MIDYSRPTYRVPSAELFSTRLPKETRTYKPVSHKELSDVTLEAIHASGFKLGVQEYRSGREGNVANARYTIMDVADSEMQLEIGWQNSYDKTLSLKFAIGTRIFICENGCVSGDLGAFKKKHMGEIKEFAPEQIMIAIKDAGETFRKIQEQREALKNIEIDKRIQSELIGRMFIEQDIINNSQLNIIKGELKTPTFDYKCPNTLWELYQHTTYAMRELHPSNWMDSHIKVHGFFVKEGIEDWADRTLSKLAVEKIMLTPKSDPMQLDLIDAIEETGK